MNHDLLPDLLLAVDQQIASSQTPYVRKAFERLIKMGIDDLDAKTQIAICLGEQMDDVLKTKRPFDEKAYRDALEELPFIEEQEDEKTLDQE